tara:strand:+ start:17224 stop:18099 length:876 start_codon:yes stop_codon:yes gene_type:complete
VNKNRYSSVNSEANNNPNLIIPRDKFVESLKDRISKGIELKNTKIDSAEMLEEKRSEQKKWNDFNIELLSRSFDNNVMSKNYSKVSGFGVMHVNPSFQQRIESFRGGMANKITNLESILERVDLIPESIAYEIENNNLAENKSNLDSVFIVHGHDEAAKSKVARFVEKLKLKAVILHEQPNQGQTIIEKFETNAAKVGFAIVLLTPDDISAPVNEPDSTTMRARQNVILELGYFCGVLGRSKVCVLYKSEVEIPSDYLGVIYTPLDDGDGWMLKLAKEMKESGLPVNLNDA